MNAIVIRGAREHNLKNLSLSIPRNQLVVITGLSGSGKSSLAFDTIYNEGQRRYLESFSSYARQFLEKMKKSDVDYIAGLSPTISIEQRQMTTNPRSTVATITEIYDYLRLLYAKVGTFHCYQCGHVVGNQTREDMLNAILQHEGHPVAFLYPLVRGRKGEYKKELTEVKKKGYTRVRIDGVMHDLHETVTMKRHVRHSIEVVIDRVLVKKDAHERLTESLATALSLGKGSVCLYDETTKKDTYFSELFYCPQCAISFHELTPNMFSFNSPYGACDTCHGLGKVSSLMADYVIVDPSKPLLKGALNEDLFFAYNKYFVEDLVARLMKSYRLPLATPYRELPDEVKDAFFWGNDDVYGLLDELREQMNNASSENMKEKLRMFMAEDRCPSCQGARLKKESLGIRIGNKHIAEVCALPVKQAKEFFDQPLFSKQHSIIAQPILREIRERIAFLERIGVGYISLDRPVSTLGGGELQRIKLGSQIGVGLSGVLYVLDEPSIGLHARDTDKLLTALRALRDMHNTVLVVEHDEETIRAADYIIDLGPGAGEAGGALMAQGPLERILKSKKSLTAQYLRKEKTIEIPAERKKSEPGRMLTVHKARAHNLKSITVSIPVGLFTCITGVSGSGKSTLIHDTIFPALHNKRWKTSYPVGEHEKITGDEHFDKLIVIDQSPIGRTPRSNAVTYTDIFVHIRKLFAALPESKVRGFSQSRFSFNLKGGRCEVCQGEGAQRMEMSFLPDVYVVCEACRGMRYNEQTLEIRYKGKNMSEVLDMSVSEARTFFDAIPTIRGTLSVLEEIGLGYIRLGQPSTTLSGGEAQRIKLASELCKKATGKTLYLLDEPTTGLHFHDINNLVRALLRLRDEGNTIVVIEHNLDMIKTADYVIDLGPEGGEKGGTVIACGTPEEIVASPGSSTGTYLKNCLNL